MDWHNENYPEEYWNQNRVESLGEYHFSDMTAIDLFKEAIRIDREYTGGIIIHEDIDYETSNHVVYAYTPKSMEETHAYRVTRVKNKIAATRRKITILNNQRPFLSVNDYDRKNTELNAELEEYLAQQESLLSGVS